MNTIDIERNGLRLLIAPDANDRPRLCYAGLAEGAAPRDPDVGRGLFFLQGETEAEIHVPSLGAKHHMSPPGTDFFYRSHHWSDTPGGQTLTLRLEWERIEAELRWRFFDDVAAVRFEVTLRNRGDAPFALNAFAPVLLHDLFRGGPMQWDRRSRIHLPHNAWYGELQWRAYRPPELGLSAVRTNSTKRIFQSNTGSWSTKEALPMGVFTDEATGASCAWQVEHSGSWAWEISDRKGELYLTAGLLSEADHHWRRVLRPGESFTSLPVGIAWAEGGFDAVLAELTRYRRKIRRPHRDNEALLVIFNDYMNCLNGDPTTGKERPLIAAANEVGCEVYCIDAGWFAPLDQNWWPAIGAWQPSGDRFEGGIEGILGEIRGAGMTPGLWLELEGMGPGCPLAREWPDACFFQRHGKRLLNRNRYQLDFRHPVVREHADAVVDRLVGWGVGYIKMDYNIDIGIGTDVEADSPGDGLLRHQRAYLDWLDAVFDRHPLLTVENCSSGGLRLDWGLLGRHSIASSSDQQDFRLNGRIAALGPTAAPPEQWAVWAYPLADDSPAAVAFNCVNALLGRIHLSGELAALPPESRALVAEAIALHKTIRDELRGAVPFWPLGLPLHGSTTWALGLRGKKRTFLAVWTLGNHANLREAIAKLGRVEPLFPGKRGAAASPGPTAALFQLSA